ncbi:MAG: N-6 DNA methylase [Planctomycetota bacterium]|jgi:type I restriction-modification system DNA methylase subunit
MLSIADADKARMQELLHGYTRARLEVVLKEARPILRRYHSLEPSKVGKRLLDKFFRHWLSKPYEAFVQYWAVCSLLDGYGYPNEHIDVEVSCGQMGRRALSGGSGDNRADVVLYSHESRRPGTAFVAIECRQPGGEDGCAQAASYSRALQCRYHLFTDSGRWDAFRTQPHPLDGIPVGDIPQWVGYKPVAKRVPKTRTMPPLTDERQLRELVKTCHNTIHGEGIDPAKAFDELVKLFFVKVFDEQEVPGVYEFSVLADETVAETARHIREMLKDAKATSRYKELFSEPGDDEFWISNAAIRKVVETFQGFSFTGDSLIGIDTKGTVYENMVGSTFRGELGQYFTPRKIVEFMVCLLEPTREDVVYDPACGSGGFLIYVLRAVADAIRTQQQNLPLATRERLIDRFVNSRLFGTDLSPRMVRAARMNMIMHGDGWSGIQRWHGLKTGEHPVLGTKLGQFSLILSNPPFAGYEDDRDILRRFECGKNEAGRLRSVNRAIVFLEHIIKILPTGGRAGLVLPRSIFENESYSFKKIRQVLYANCEILAVVGLPRTAFHHTDCGILGDLLFIKKSNQPRRDYGVFVARAEEVGYNTLGHNIDANDLHPILEGYRASDSTFLLPISRLMSEDNINPWHYDPKARKLRRRIKQQSDLVPLADLVSVYNNRISRKALRQTPERRLRYAQVREFDPETGVFQAVEHTINSLPSRATYEMNGEEVLLLPNARNSLESGRRVIRVGEELGGVILTNRFLPLRAKVNPEYLVLVLNTPFVRQQLIAACRGAGSPDLREGKLASIMIPVPDKEDLSSIDSFMERVADKMALKESLIGNLESVSKEIETALESLCEGR